MRYGFFNFNCCCLRPRKEFGSAADHGTLEISFCCLVIARLNYSMALGGVLITNVIGRATCGVRSTTSVRQRQCGPVITRPLWPGSILRHWSPPGLGALQG